MNKRNFVLTLITIVMVLSLPLSTVAAIPPADEGSGVDLVWDDPMPIYPFEEAIHDKTPQFRFTQYADVTKYRIKVRNFQDESIEYYTYKGTANCVDFECRMTPDIPLAGGVVTFENDIKGYYEWTVEAKVAPGVWSGIQDYARFGLGTTGFTSTFTIDKKGWLDRYAQWVLTSAGYLKNIGLEREYTSTLYKKKIYGNFTVQAKFKLKSSSNYASDDPNRHFGGIIIYGNGTLNTEPDYPSEMNAWRKGIYIILRNNQQAAIFVYDGGTLIGGSGWQSCPQIIPGGWNTIKVTEVNGTITVDINGTEWRTYNHPFINDSGYIGLTQYRYAAETETMLVDQVKLEVDTP